MSFTRCWSPIVFTSIVNKIELLSFDCIRHLGLMFVSFLFPCSHVDRITYEVYELLGFVKKISSEYMIANSL